MSQVKVSDLPAASGLSTSDVVIVNQSGVTKRTTAGAFTDTMTGFVAAGSASDVTNRTIQARAREVVTITDYKNTDGTQVATSVADNGTGIAKAITAVTTNGGLVFTPVGTFGHSTSQTIPANVGLLGQGQNASIWDYTGASVGVTTAASGSYFSTQGMRLTTSTGTTNFRVQGTASWVTCTDTAFVGGTTAGVYLTGTANNIKFVTCTMTDCGDGATANSGGILADGNTNGVGIVGCNINSNDGWGIAVVAVSRGWSITGGTVVEANALGGMHATGITGLSINGTYWENTTASTYQISLANLGATLNLGVDIRGNIFSCAATFDCLNLQYITGLTVESNEFRATRYAIDASGGNLTNYRIANNQVLAGANLWYDGTDVSDAQVITDVGQTHKAGTGDGTFTPAGRFARSITAGATIADTNETVLQTITVPANTLSANGQMLRMRAWGTTGANGNTKTVRIRVGGIGGTTLGLFTGAHNGLNWDIDAILIRTGAATEDGTSVARVGTTVGATDFTTHTITLTADTTIVVTGLNGTASANDIICEGVLAEYIP